ncbi:hypothetical protein GCM10010347_26580 [Streptomyces cirratus]|uniref:Uncharacterized protein n=1 Tax=Streptomyces cirratus TaxID=68187 RepID=A0ABQ3ERL8_9ACTN|nr:hypothetical protein GCM10010347_26580 [Streptomyces cirratus]
MSAAQKATARCATAEHAAISAAWRVSQLVMRPIIPRPRRHARTVRPTGAGVPSGNYGQPATARAAEAGPPAQGAA